MNFYSEIDNLQMYVNSEGGVVESLKDSKVDILYPMKEIKLKDGSSKVRGGIHSCMPNFGIDSLGKLNNHGYGRDFNWDLLDKKENYIALFLRGLEDYSNLDSYLEYEIKENTLRMSLTFINRDKKDLLIAPGFHPYFKSENSYVKVEGNTFNNEELENSVYLEGNELNFETKKYKFKYTGKNINTFVVWSDFKDDYICVEPTYNGPSFLKSYNKNPYNLKPREKFEFEAILSWEPK